MYTMKDVSKTYSLSQYTIRYYDKEGLLPFVKRDQLGRRIFSIEDMELLGLICCLKDSGMSIKYIKNYISLMKNNKQTEARLLLINHRNKVVEQIKNLNVCLNTIDDNLLELN